MAIPPIEPAATGRPNPSRAEAMRIVRFLLSGGVAAAANIGSRWVLGHVLDYEAAVALAYLVGMATAFTLMRRYVFDRSTASRQVQLARFALVNLVGFAQVWCVSVGLATLVFPAIGFTFQADTVAHVIGVGSPVLTSFVLHRQFSFRDPRRSQR